MQRDDSGRSRLAQGGGGHGSNGRMAYPLPTKDATPACQESGQSTYRARSLPLSANRRVSPEEVMVGTGNLVLVLWQDAWFDPDQCGENEWRDEYLVSSVGFIVRETDTVLSIAMECLPEEDGYRAVTHVPWGMIVEVRSLEHRADAGKPHRSTLSERFPVADSNGPFAGPAETVDLPGPDANTFAS
jgi:hypothetical protein